MDLIDHLRRIPLFMRLSADNLRILADAFIEHRLAARVILTRQAELGSNFFVLDSGEAVVHRVDEQGQYRPVGGITGGPGVHFGTTSLFLGEPRDATITVSAPMHLWTIRRPAFQQLLQVHGSLRRQLLIPDEVLAKLRARHYAWLEPGEIVLFDARRHPIALLRRLFPATVLLVLYVAAVFVLRLSVLQGVSLALLLGPALVPYTALLAWDWVDWFNDRYVVTNRRISHRERVAFIYESRHEAPLDRVQNINVQGGPLGNLLGYGQLTVATAASVGTMVMSYVPHPAHMRDAIWHELGRAQATRRAIQRDRMRDTLVDYMRLDSGEVPPETLPGEESPLALSEAPPAPERGLWIKDALQWLADTDIIPRTCIVTPDSVTWRKHWVFLLRTAGPWALLAVGSALLLMLSFFGLPAVLLAWAPWAPPVLMVITVVFLGLLWWTMTDWGNDLYIVTNERIIDIEKRPLFFAMQRREASLGMIQNVHFEVPHVVAGLLGYGSVVVQTAGAGEFTFQGVPNPSAVQAEIFQRMQAYRTAQEER
ncbi:MAG: PH domain-containing protein, partial [Chloroflexota bacterium]